MTENFSRGNCGRVFWKVFRSPASTSSFTRNSKVRPVSYSATERSIPMRTAGHSQVGGSSRTSRCATVQTANCQRSVCGERTSTNSSASTLLTSSAGPTSASVSLPVCPRRKNLDQQGSWHGTSGGPSATYLPLSAQTTRGCCETSGPSGTASARPPYVRHLWHVHSESVTQAWM